MKIIFEIVKMKKILGFTLSLVLLLSACKDARTKQYEEITKLNAALMEAVKKDPTQVDKQAAKTLIEKSEAFVAQFPKDTVSAGLLFKAAELNSGIGEYGKAIKIWGDVNTNYPTYKRAGDALFMQAFTFDEYLHDKDNAITYYKSFINNYPNHSMKANATQLLSLLEGGKDFNDIIKEFEQKNKSEIGR